MKDLKVLGGKELVNYLFSLDDVKEVLFLRLGAQGTFLHAC